MSKLVLAMAALLSLRPETDETVLAETAREQFGQLNTQLSSLHKALGVKNAEEAASKIAAMFSTIKEYETAKPELELLRKTTGEAENAAALRDVDAVLASFKLPDNMRDLLLEARKKDKADFERRFPMPPVALEHLTQTVFANSEGAQFAGRQTVGNGAVALTAGGGAAGVDLQTLNMYPGRNRVEQCMSFIKATVAGAKDWSHSQLHSQACELNKRIPASA